MDYVQITPEQEQQMLGAIGVETIDGLFASLPPEYRLNEPLDLPEPLSELELQRELAGRAAANRTVGNSICFMGGGAYDHFIPSVVDDVARRGEFVTAYTPYQAEALQGALQAFFEFQTQLCRLSGLDVANASLYEGASAVSEAAYMALNVTGRRRVLVADSLHPHYRQVLQASLADLPVDCVSLPIGADGCVSTQTVADHLDADTACVIIQSPNVFGLIEDSAALFDTAHQQSGTLAIAVFNPIACALLKNPGACGADVAVGEGQPLGIPLQYGGPYVGLFAARERFMRKMPGRLVGRTTDAEGRFGYCLTLQTREQHIRGAKATSNICTNQGLLALRASVYMTAMGPSGLRTVAEQCYHKAHYAAQQIAAIDGIEPAHSDQPFFNEFVVRLPVAARSVIDAGREKGIQPGVALTDLGIGETNHLLIAVTEKRSRADIDVLVDLLKEVCR
jgi:glycine dehydrogenase subunit 1